MVQSSCFLLQFAVLTRHGGLTTKMKSGFQKRKDKRLPGEVQGYCRGGAGVLQGRHASLGRHRGTAREARLPGEAKEVLQGRQASLGRHRGTAGEAHLPGEVQGYCRGGTPPRGGAGVLHPNPTLTFCRGGDAA